MLPIQTPTNTGQITLNCFATNGTDTSPVITQIYGTDTVTDARLPHAAVIQNIDPVNLGPFGSAGDGFPTGIYANPGQAGLTVDAAGVTPTQSSGLFDAAGNPEPGVDSFPNEFVEDFPAVYSETDDEGRVGPQIGTLVKSKVARTKAPPEQSSRADKIFNPRAMVIFQDSTTDDPSNPPMINREFFSLENPEHVRDGALLYNTALDTPTATGSYIRSHYNPRDNTLTYYFYDNSVNRWIISKSPYVQKDPNFGNLSQMAFGRQTGIGLIFQWRTFARRFLT